MLKPFVIFVVIFVVSCVSKQDSVKVSLETVLLFNGKDLSAWTISGFGGDGEVEVQDGAIMMDYGTPMTGLTYSGEILRINYEIELEALKVDGNDFFVGLTFPYKNNYLTLILGGWGWVTCGLSSFDDADASENDTSFVKLFHKDKWYHVKLQVMDKRIVVFLDDEKVIDKRILEQQKIHTRPEVELSKPLGLAAFETQVKYKNIILRELTGSSSEN